MNFEPPTTFELELMGVPTPCDDCPCEICLAGEYEECWRRTE